MKIILIMYYTTSCAKIVRGIYSQAPKNMQKQNATTIINTNKRNHNHTHKHTQPQSHTQTNATPIINTNKRNHSHKHKRNHNHKQTQLQSLTQTQPQVQTQANAARATHTRKRNRNHKHTRKSNNINVRFSNSSSLASSPRNGSVSKKKMNVVMVTVFLSKLRRSDWKFNQCHPWIFLTDFLPRIPS